MKVAVVGIEGLLNECGLAPAKYDNVGARRERRGEIPRNRALIRLHHPGDWSVSAHKSKGLSGRPCWADRDAKSIRCGD